uniref:UBA domain-containing protein n=1 Tax=Noctiluca scintillans TaxID=2966 RepID=A0A7S1AMG0_NOCSC
MGPDMPTAGADDPSPREPLSPEPSGPGAAPLDLPGASVPMVVQRQEPAESDVRCLVDVTDRPYEECLRALVATGSVDAAAAYLLDEGGGAISSSCVQSTLDRGRGVQSTATSDGQAVGTSDEARFLVEATGRSLSECAAALEANSSDVGAACAFLFASTTECSPATADSLVGHADGVERTVPDVGLGQTSGALEAARMTEVTGSSYEVCLQALRACGSVEEAVASLLGLTDEQETVPQQPGLSIVDQVPLWGSGLASTNEEADGAPDGSPRTRLASTSVSPHEDARSEGSPSPAAKRCRTNSDE